MSKNVQPIQGAARYTVGMDNGDFVVLMIDTEGFMNAIQRGKSFDAMVRAADKWQTKENKAVLRDMKK